MLKHTLRRRIGRRGAILLCLSVVDIGYGASLIGPEASEANLPAMAWRELYAPLWAWGGVWLFVAAVLIVSAFMVHDEIGYVAAIGLKIVWSLTSLASWLIGDVPRGWVAAIIWGVVGLMVWIIAPWPEEPEPPADPEGR